MDNQEKIFDESYIAKSDSTESKKHDVAEDKALPDDKKEEEKYYQKNKPQRIVIRAIIRKYD